MFAVSKAIPSLSSASIDSPLGGDSSTTADEPVSTELDMLQTQAQSDMESTSFALPETMDTTMEEFA